jgi:hypothetical protein
MRNFALLRVLTRWTSNLRPSKTQSKVGMVEDAFRIFSENEGFSRFEEAVKFYQRLGFFGERSTDDVIKQFFLGRGRPPLLQNWWDEAFLLGCENKEVWCGDPEADVGPEGNVYRYVLREWASISHGVFNPSEISEHWDHQGGAVSIHFDLDGRRVSVSAQNLDDWIDLDILKQINPLMQRSERQFNYVCIENWCIVLCLTADQKQQMVQYRAFPFAF